MQTTTYGYDANGNLTSKNDGLSTTNYAYDVWGNMTSADNASYAYNAQGLRISKTINGTTDNFVLVGGDVWADAESTYLRGLELIASDDYFYLYNIRGDVIQLLDYNGEVVKTYDYDAYGNELTRDLNDENPFRYCGEYYDTETGLVYLRARYYDPNVGRFTSVDPIKDGLNWYAYCGNNPVNFIDPSGLKFVGALHDPRMSTYENGNAYSQQWVEQHEDDAKEDKEDLNVGAAEPYTPAPSYHEDPNAVNCYAYAIKHEEAINPGDISGRTPFWGDVNDVALSVIADLNALGQFARILSNVDDEIFDDEYRIALRISSDTLPSTDIYNKPHEFHFMVQTDTGQWAEKYGTAYASEIHSEGETPDTIPWLNAPNGLEAYDGRIVYIAVGKKVPERRWQVCGKYSVSAVLY